jgi:hypothetical protein
MAMNPLHAPLAPTWKALCLAGGLLASTLAGAAQVGVSISVHQPGLYGRIDLGGMPPPPPPVLVYPQPVVMVPGPVAVYQQPIYLRVPPGHSRNWRKHCYRYNACGQPVYFVRGDWHGERHDDDHRH